MTSRVFLDTNIIVYANDARDPVKQRRAAELVSQHARNGTGVISIQVLQEYASTALSKLNQESSVVLRYLRLLESMFVVPITPQFIRRGVELRKIYSVNFWDAMIIAAAEEAECSRLLSEDFNPGQYYGGILAVNPFAGNPEPAKKA